MKDLPLVQIDWVDSMRTGGWRGIKQAEADLADHPLLDCQSVGYLLGENEAGVMIARDINPANDSIDDTIIIPKVAITGRKVLRAAK